MLATILIVMTSRIYLPYIIGTDSPIPNLFENILSYYKDSDKEYYIHKNSNEDIYSSRNIHEIYSYDSNNLLKKISYRAVRKYFPARYKFDIIHTGGRTHHKTATQIAKYRNENIHHIHSQRIDISEELDNFSIWKKLAERADTVTAVSESTGRSIRENTNTSADKIIYNGVDIEIFNPNYTSPKLIKSLNNINSPILYVGSLTKRKRPEDIISVAKKFKQFDFLIIGDGPMYDQMKKKSRSIENVYMTGRVEKSELPPIYANSKAFLFPSIQEGCPNVVLEAMASGLPIIGYNATSMPELVTDGITGFLSSSIDSSGLIHALDRLIKTENAEVIGTNARRYAVNNHSFSVIADDYEDLYDGILKSDGFQND